MVAEIAALVIFVIMFLLIVLDRIPRQWVTLGWCWYSASVCTMAGPYGIL